MVQHVTAVKFILFPMPDAVAGDVASLWTRVVGTSPQSFQVVPPNPMLPPGGATASGPLSSGNGSLTVSPGRIELAITATPTPGPSVGIGDPGAAFAEGKRLIQSVGELAVTRVAVNVEATTNLENSADFFGEYASGLPIANVPSDAHDVLLQLNRRKDFHGILLNRVVRWNQGVEQFVEFNIGMGTGTAPVFKVTEKPLAQMAVDVNTHPGPHMPVIPNDRLADLWDALAQEAQAILFGGYDYIRNQ